MMSQKLFWTIILQTHERFTNFRGSEEICGEKGFRGIPDVPFCMRCHTGTTVQVLTTIKCMKPEAIFSYLYGRFYNVQNIGKHS